MSQKTARLRRCRAAATALARRGQQRDRVVGGGDRQHLELRRPRTQHVGQRAHQAFTQRVVRDDEDSDHAGWRQWVATTGVAAKMLARADQRVGEQSAPTSNPVCSVISTKQVGLVTLTSVRKRPMTSRPTTSRPSAHSVGRQRLADLAVARRQRPRDAAAARREVAARLARLGNARQRIRDRARPRSAGCACRRR